MTVTKADEPSLRDQLLADYDAHEDAIEDAARGELWALGDWLAKWVPPRHPGPRGVSDPEGAISLEDLAERRGRSLRWLQRARKLALATEVDRLPMVSPRAYEEALNRNGWDLMKANASLVTRGHRLRDQTPYAMESVDAVKANLDKRTPEQRAEVARELNADPTVRELLGGEPLPEFGASWADLYVVRIDEQAAKLTSLIEHEGLVFSPDSELQPFLDMLERTERRVADVRAAVQERIRDARMEGVS
jgi:hypothetical protein